MDNEGGNIAIGSKSGKVFEMGAYNDTNFRIFSQQSGSVKSMKLDGTNGNLSVDGGVSSCYTNTVTKSSGDTYFRAIRTNTDQQIQFGIDGGGENRGIHNTKLNRWVFKITNASVDLSAMGILYSATQPTAPWTSAIWLKPV